MTEEIVTAKQRRSLIMMRSLYSGVSGLKIHQTRMDVIGNNIANVNTVGFKAQKVSFSELFYQTTQVASGPNAEKATGGQNAKQIGLGASVGQISVNITQEGGSQSTGNAFDLKINGSSFFVVESGGVEYYTKAGNFTTDGFGNLVTGTGAYVMGYTAVRDEESGDFILQTDGTRPISLYSDEYMYTAPAQTTNATMNGNIDSEDADFTTTGMGFKAPDLYVYDSLGNKYGIQMKIEQVEGSTTEYIMTPNKIFKGTEEIEDMSAVFVGDGVTTTEGLTSVSLTFDGTTGLLTTDPSEITIQVMDADGDKADAFQQDIVMDFSDLTCYASEYSVTAEKDQLGGGKAVGNMISLGIQTDGKIIASYDNGDTSCIGQIVTATFANPAGLEKAGDNMFASTLNSGDPTVEDISSFGESMNSGVVEMSNVDLAAEFTDMIVTQRGFQANSRVITTSDTMIEELVNLKR